MSSKSGWSSIGKKVAMGLTGLFLISFLVVHVGINAAVFLNDGGKTFMELGHFMGTNPVIRTMEIGLVIGFLWHIIEGIYLFLQNKKARPQGYAYTQASANSKWYSRSMMLLGTLILLFLVLHTADFWIPNRANQFATGEEINLYEKMKLEFSEWWVVLIYVGGCFSLFWHLLHGFKSAFQSLGLNHPKYNGIIAAIGTAFAIIVPLVFAAIPVAMFLGLVK